MEFNSIATGIVLAGTTIRSINLQNSIVDAEKEAKRSLNIDIKEPVFTETDGSLFAQLVIDFVVELEQTEQQRFKLELSLEGAFLSSDNADRDSFNKLVMINGASALIGIARGKIEAISANIFNNGKVSIPFVNVLDYYKSVS